MTENWEEFIKTLHGHPQVYEILRRLAQLHSDKNTDYAAGGPPLGNFERVGQWITTYQLWKLAQTRPALFTSICYLLKQLDAVFDMLGKQREAVVESVPKKLDDVAVYSIIAQVLYEEGK